MAASNRIYTPDDLMANRASSVVSLGYENILNSVTAYGNFIAKDTAEQLSMFVEDTPNSREFWGGVGHLKFTKAGAFGKTETQLEIKDQEVQFPIDKLVCSQGWNTEFWKRANALEARKLMLDLDNAYNQRVRDEIQRAIFRSTARPAWKSEIYGYLGTLDKIQPFVNADGNNIPDAPNGTTFAGATHNHYLAVTGASVAYTDVDYLLGHVMEHVPGKIILFVDPAMPATLTALASTKFVYNQYTNVISKTTADIGKVATIDGEVDRSNLFIGTWNGFEVHTRSWVPTGYMAAISVNANDKPIHRRIDPMFEGMQTDGLFSDGRMSNQMWFTYQGYAVFNRVAGACLDTTHQATYSDPSTILTD